MANLLRKIVFDTIPENFDEFRNLEMMDLSKPEYTAALCIISLIIYTLNNDEFYKIIKYLKGPFHFTDEDLINFKQKFQGKYYVPRSYLQGATPDNNYTPTKPYTINLSISDYYKSDENDEYMAKVYIDSACGLKPGVLFLKKTSSNMWHIVDADLLYYIQEPNIINF